MSLPVVLIHGYSSEGKTADDGVFTVQDVGAIYGRLVDDLRSMGERVVSLNLGRYISLDDGIGVDDLSLGFHRALSEAGLQNTPFNAIIHSTGALVMRNWVRRFAKPDGTCPLKRLIHLAGANLGSGWAHVGATQFARFGRTVQGVQPGLAVLRDLELASSWAIDLHTHFLDEGHDMFHDYGVMEFNLVGSQTPPEYLVAPIRYGREDGSDGVVRVSASNLNFNYVQIVPTDTASAVDWNDAVDFAEKAAHQDALESGAGARFDRDYYKIARFSRVNPPEGGAVAPTRPQIPFAIPYGTTHSDAAHKTGIVSGEDNRDSVLPLIGAALDATVDDYAALVARFDAATDETYDQVREPAHSEGLLAMMKAAVRDAVDNPRGQYDPHAHLVIRVRDHLGQPVDDFSVFFNSFGGDAPDTLIDCLFEDSHKNGATPSTMDYYLRVKCWDDAKKDWISRLEGVNGATLEIDAVEPSSRRVLYLPLRMHLNSEDLVGWLEPHRTTIIDVRLMRLPHRVAFILR